MPMQRRFALRAGQALTLGGGLVALTASMPLAEAAEPARPVVKVLAARPARAEGRPGETVRVSFDLEAPARWQDYPAARKPLLGRRRSSSS